jgi:hypothetical protein
MFQLDAGHRGPTPLLLSGRLMAAFEVRSQVGFAHTNRSSPGTNPVVREFSSFNELVDGRGIDSESLRDFPNGEVHGGLAKHLSCGQPPGSTYVPKSAGTGPTSRQSVIPNSHRVHTRSIFG